MEAPIALTVSARLATTEGIAGELIVSGLHEEATEPLAELILLAPLAVIKRTVP